MKHPDSGNGERDVPVSEEAGDSFSRLANTIRLEVLHVLARESTPLPYGELFERVSVSDSGQFNYHLRQLRGEYVRQTDDGYELRQTGVRAANVLASNTLQKGIERPPSEIESECGRCGSTHVEIGYQQGEALVRCRACDRSLTRFDFPPEAARTLSLDAFVDAYAQRTRKYVALADDGICPFCSHQMTTAVRLSAATQSDSIPVAAECSECPAGIRAPIGLVLLNRPRVSTAFYDAGVDFSETPFWERRWCTFGAPTVHQTTPLLVELETTVDGESWRILVNEEVEIEAFDRSSADCRNVE